jgi:transposase
VAYLKQQRRARLKELGIPDPVKVEKEKEAAAKWPADVSILINRLNRSGKVHHTSGKSWKEYLGAFSRWDSQLFCSSRWTLLIPRLGSVSGSIFGIRCVFYYA